MSMMADGATPHSDSRTTTPITSPPLSPRAQVGRTSSVRGTSSQPMSSHDFIRQLQSTTAIHDTLPEGSTPLHEDVPVATAAPHREYSIYLVGPAGSGKTTLKKVVTTKTMLKKLPEPTLTLSTTAQHYYHKTQKGGVVDIVVVDTGGTSMRHGLTRSFQGRGLYVLVWNMSGTIQKKQRFLFGSTQSTIPQRDIQEIMSYLAAVESVAPRSVVIIVGTHRDKLNDSSHTAVEGILDNLRNEVLEKLSERQSSLNLLSCFGVSCSNHSCVAENKGSVETIQSMWGLLCDMSFKMSTDPRVADASALSAGVNPQAFLNCLQRLRNEHSIVAITRRRFHQLAHGYGFRSSDEIQSITHRLEERGEIQTLYNQVHTADRHNCVLLCVNILSRVVTAITQYSAMRYSPSAQRKLLASVDFELCDAVEDAEGQLGRGMIGPQLCRALFHKVFNKKSTPESNIALACSVLLHADFAFKAPQDYSVSASFRNSKSRASFASSDMLSRMPSPTSPFTDVEAMTLFVPSMFRFSITDEMRQKIVSATKSFGIARKVALGGSEPLPHFFPTLICRTGHMASVLSATRRPALYTDMAYLTDVFYGEASSSRAAIIMNAATTTPAGKHTPASLLVYVIADCSSAMEMLMRQVMQAIHGMRKLFPSVTITDNAVCPKCAESSPSYYRFGCCKELSQAATWGWRREIDSDSLAHVALEVAELDWLLRGRE